MKHFFKKNSVFILLAVILIIFISNYYNKGFVKKSNANMTENEFLEQGPATTNTTKGFTQTKPIFNEHLESNIILIGNLETGQIIFGKNIDVRTSIASITKWMSAVVFLENDDIDSVVEISEEIYSILPHKNDLLLHEQILAKDLLKMALIMSSNDAIVALANNKNFDGFIKNMNEKAFDIGMYHTKFDNPIGFDSEENYSTATDLFHLSRYIYQSHPLIGEISKIRSYGFVSNSDIYHLVIPTNAILDKLENFWGGKTGFTSQANESLLSIFEIEHEGEKQAFVSVVIQSPDRFLDTLKIADWLKQNKSLLIKP